MTLFSVQPKKRLASGRETEAKEKSSLRKKKTQ